MEPLVEMESMDKWFGNTHAVDNVDMKVYPQEILGLIGNNGAGKSTLVNMLIGLLEPDGGKMKFKGEEFKSNSVNDARDLEIEIAFQKQSLIGCFSIKKNIFLGKEPTKSVGPVNVIDKDKMARESERLIKKLGLEIENMDKEVQYCSGGEQQGIVLARAMVSETSLVILDEPTRGMSVEAVQDILDMIGKLKKKETTVIVITHRIDQLYPIADRFFFMRNGKKVGDVEKKDISKSEVEGFLTGKIGIKEIRA